MKNIDIIIINHFIIFKIHEYYIIHTSRSRERFWILWIYFMIRKYIIDLMKLIILWYIEFSIEYCFHWHKNCKLSLNLNQCSIILMILRLLSLIKKEIRGHHWRFMNSLIYILDNKILDSFLKTDIIIIALILNKLNNISHSKL